MKTDFMLKTRNKKMRNKTPTKLLPIGLGKFLPDPILLIPALFAAYPVRSGLMLTAMITASVCEGIGILSLLPIFELVMQNGEPQSEVGQKILLIFQASNIEPILSNMLLLVFVLVLCKSAMILIARYFVSSTSSQIVASLRHQFVDTIMAGSWAFFINLSVGRANSVITQEAQRGATVYRSACELVSSIVQAVILLSGTWIVSKYAAIGGIMLGITLVVALNSLITYTRLANQQLRDLLRSLNSRMSDLLRGIKPMKAMNEETRMSEVLHAEISDLDRVMRRYFLAKQMLSTVREPIIVGALALGLYLLIDVAGVAATAAFTSGLLFYRSASAIGAAQHAYEALSSSEPYYTGVVSEIRRASDNEERETVNGLLSIENWNKIRLEDVHVSYGSKSVLRGVDLELNRGQIVSLVGESGSGKTTISDVVTGLVRPDCGAVYVQGENLLEIRLDTWRDQIGYVPQDLFLLHKTVFENVTLGDTRFSRQDVEDVLKKVDAKKYVDQLANGMDTVVGEQGNALSGGQRQRLSIARAIIRKPHLLILDEATTALDPETATEICRTVKAISSDMAVLTISHQQEMTKIADKIVQLEAGIVHTVSSAN